MGTGAEQSFTLISPISKVVLSRRPILSWKPLSGATSYTVTITDPQNNYQSVAVSPPLTITDWQVQQPLQRGRTYAWVVVAEKDGQKITAPSAATGEARFKVLEQARADEISHAEKKYDGIHLVKGLLYAQAGLLEEAEREFQALVAANLQSPVAKALLRDVQTKRR